ncbi:MAG: hypothetical protein SYR96_38110 [Actinomycetota bacterium]|nr:hypothetical protein [Actinomycetota bacterium]
MTVTACTSSAERAETGSGTPAPRPSAGTSLKTVPGLDIGEQVTVTAAVSRILADSAFTISDVDLPEDGLLTLALTSDRLRPRSLVTVHGTIDRFDFDRIGGAYELAHREPFEEFTGQKYLIAQDIRVWSGSSRPGPSTL